MPAEKVLRILHIEDDDPDAELVQIALEGQGIKAAWVRVQTRDDFLRALEHGEFDLIISDYSMPSFDGLTALSLAKEKKPEIPFIYLSGTIGEERAVEALQNGATDYVLKDRMFRLGSVIRRSMKDAALRAQRRLVEEQLHRTFTQMQRLLTASPVVIYSAPYSPGAAESFVSENVRVRFGWDPEDFTQGPDFWLSRVHPDDREKVLSRLQALGRDEPGPINYRFQHADGTWRWVEDHMNLVRDEAGFPREIVGSLTDVSATRQLQEEVARMEEQFHQAQKLEAIGSLAGGVAHDFNNLLMVILSYSSFILVKLPADNPLRREVEEIQKAGNRAADLTHQLLAFSRKETLNPRNIDPRDAVKNLTKMLGRLIGDNIRLSLDLGSEDGFIFCDPMQFDQILINLVVNARDAMPGGGEVTIETLVTPDNEYCISVKDTGVGMSRETMSRIFEPFFTTKPVGKGTGLGLSMVYGAVQQNKGRILVESEIGKGTAMRMHFRRVTAPGKPYESATAAEQAPGTGRTILLVEDDESVRKATARLLEDLGFVVIEAAGAETAFALFSRRKEEIDLVVTDVIVPGMSGPQLAQRIRALRSDVLIVFSTGYLGEIEMVERELGNGVPVIQKPFDGRTFMERIRTAMALAPKDAEA